MDSEKILFLRAFALMTSRPLSNHNPVSANVRGIDYSRLTDVLSSLAHFQPLDLPSGLLQYKGLEWAVHYPWPGCTFARRRTSEPVDDIPFSSPELSDSEDDVVGLPHAPQGIRASRRDGLLREIRDQSDRMAELMQSCGSNYISAVRKQSEVLIH